MTAPSLPDLAALKKRLRHAGASDGMNAFECRQMLAELESRLAVPVGEALVEAAAEDKSCHCPAGPGEDCPLSNEECAIRALGEAGGE